MTQAPTRERVLHLLAEASELEHNLLCSYLFALFSLKRRADEGLTESEQAAIQRWRTLLLGVCVEEMVHLVQVANMTSALGVIPHFNRPNLPAAPNQRRDGGVAKLIPTAPEYATVGEFYGVLRGALEGFADRPEPVFSIDTFQLSGEMIDAPALVVITTIEDVRLAIDRIVEQGEGASQQRDDSHFSRFTSMLQELSQLKQERPEFEPARAVGPNPVMRAPQVRCRTHVTAPQALKCLDTFNAVYWMMLRALSALYAAAPGSPSIVSIVAHMMGCMHLLSDLADPLTEQPARVDGADVMAGPSFTMFRHSEGPATTDHALAQLRERCAEIATQVEFLPLGDEARLRIETRLSQMSSSLAGPGEEPAH